MAKELSHRGQRILIELAARVAARVIQYNSSNNVRESAFDPSLSKIKRLEKQMALLRPVIEKEFYAEVGRLGKEIKAEGITKEHLGETLKKNIIESLRKTFKETQNYYEKDMLMRLGRGSRNKSRERAKEIIGRIRREIPQEERKSRVTRRRRLRDSLSTHWGQPDFLEPVQIKGKRRYRTSYFIGRKPRYDRGEFLEWKHTNKVTKESLEAAADTIVKRMWDLGIQNYEKASRPTSLGAKIVGGMLEQEMGERTNIRPPVESEKAVRQIAEAVYHIVVEGRQRPPEINLNQLTPCEIGLFHKYPVLESVIEMQEGLKNRERLEKKLKGLKEGRSGLKRFRPLPKPKFLPRPK